MDLRALGGGLWAPVQGLTEGMPEVVCRPGGSRPLAPAVSGDGYVLCDPCVFLWPLVCLLLIFLP